MIRGLITDLVFEPTVLEIYILSLIFTNVNSNFLCFLCTFMYGLCFKRMFVRWMSLMFAICNKIFKIVYFNVRLICNNFVLWQLV
jgi:hypothetical protein